MQTKKQELARRIFKACYLQGDFLLRSGRRSKEYFDKYNLESDPELLSDITDLMIPMIPEKTEILAGLDLGGIPLAVALSLKTKIPARFVRKKAKDYGTMNICEGGAVEGKKICIVEDVITTGGQVLESAKELKKAGALVSDVICIVFRGENKQSLEKENLKLNHLFSLEDLKSS